MQYRICPGVTFGLLTILLRFWTSICPYLLDVTSRPSVCLTRISLGLMTNAGMLLASRRRLIFGGPVIALWLTGKSLFAVKWANETYSDAKRQFSDRNGADMNVQSPHKWGSALNPRCSARVRQCLRLLMRVVRLICCRIILTTSSPGRPLICRSLVIRLLVIPLLPSGRERGQASLVRLGPIWWHWPIGYVSSFS